jgi:hypothetical protein
LFPKIRKIPLFGGRFDADFKKQLVFNDKTYPKMFTKLEYATKLSPNSGVQSYSLTEKI